MRSADRSASSPGPAPARPARSPTGSPTACTPAPSRPSRCSRSPSPPGPRGSCATGCAASASAGCRPAPSTPRRCASCATSRPGCSAAPMPGAGREQAAGWWPTPPPGPGCATDRTELRDLPGEIEWAKTHAGHAGRLPGRARAGRSRAARSTPAAVAAVYAGYERPSSARASLDFEDLLLVTAGALEEHRDVAGEVRGQYRHFVVDEYQDVNPLQQRLLDAWLGGRADLCVVGDPNQTIYSFTGATPDYLLGFADRYPERRGGRLERDYRSTPAGRRAGQPADRPGAAARAARPAAARPARRPDPSRGSPSTPTSRPRPPRWPPAAARWSTRGMPAAEIAVLFRINAQSAGLRVGADRRRGALRAAGRRAVLRAARGARGGAAAARRGPRGRHDAPAGRRRGARRAGLGWAGSSTAAARAGAARDRWQSLAALVDLAVDLVGRAAPALDLAELVADLAERADAQHAPTVAGRHAGVDARGQGPGVGRRLRRRAGRRHRADRARRPPEPVEEERRLLYVAITRAREQLTLSWSLARSPGGRASRRPPGSWTGCRYGRQPPGRGARPGRSRPARRAAAPAVCRICGAGLVAAVDRKLGRCAGCPSDRDEALFERCGPGGPAGRRSSGSRRTACSPTPRCSPSPRPAPDRGGAGGHPGNRAGQAGAVRRGRPRPGRGAAAVSRALAGLVALALLLATVSALPALGSRRPGSVRCWYWWCSRWPGCSSTPRWRVRCSGRRRRGTGSRWPTCWPFLRCWWPPRWPSSTCAAEPGAGRSPLAAVRGGRP